MINEYYKIMKDYAERNDIPLSVTKVSNELYISTQPFTFNGGAMAGNELSQDIFITEAGIISACRYDTEIKNTEVFEELSGLFNEYYHTEIKYEFGEKAVHSSLSFSPDDKTDDEDFFLLTTLPWVCMRMFMSIYREITDNPLDMDNYKEILEDGDIPFDLPYERDSLQLILFEEAVENEDYYMDFSQLVYRSSGKSPRAKTIELKSQSPEGARYFFEHVHFPDLFYINPNEFIGMAASNCDAFFNELIKNISESREIPEIPGYNHFDTEVIDDAPYRKCIRIIMPEPNLAPDCSDIFLFSSAEEGASYYTIETDKDKDGNEAFYIGYWNEIHNHANYGQYGTREDAVEEVMNMIMLME